MDWCSIGQESTHCILERIQIMGGIYDAFGNTQSLVLLFVKVLKE